VQTLRLALARSADVYIRSRSLLPASGPPWSLTAFVGCGAQSRRAAASSQTDKYGRTPRFNKAVCSSSSPYLSLSMPTFPARYAINCSRVISFVLILHSSHLR